jgi:hypothetical protein
MRSRRAGWPGTPEVFFAPPLVASLPSPAVFTFPPSRLRRFPGTPVVYLFAPPSFACAHYPGTPANYTYPPQRRAPRLPHPPSSSGQPSGASYKNRRGSRSDFPIRTKLAVNSHPSPLATPDLIRGHLALPPSLSAFATPAPRPVLRFLHNPIPAQGRECRRGYG